MTKPELLENLSKLERESKVLEIKIKVWKDEKGKLDLIKRNEEVKSEIEKLKRDLTLATVNNNKEKDSRESKIQEVPKSNKTPKNSEEAGSQEKSKTFEELKVGEEPKITEKTKGDKESKEEETTKDKEVNDNIYKQLTELELLKTLSQLEKESRTLETKIKTGNEENEKLTWSEQNEVIKGKIEILKKNLASINDKRYGEEAKSSIIRQLKENILEINDAGKEKIEKELFEKKFGDLYSVVATKISADKTPNLPSYKTVSAKAIDTKEFTDFLIQEIQIITNIDEPSYSSLREYLAGLKDRILKRFIE